MICMDRAVTAGAAVRATALTARLLAGRRTLCAARATAAGWMKARRSMSGSVCGWNERRCGDGGSGGSLHRPSIQRAVSLSSHSPPCHCSQPRRLAAGGSRHNRGDGGKGHDERGTQQQQRSAAATRASDDFREKSPLRYEDTTTGEPHAKQHHQMNSRTQQLAQLVRCVAGQQKWRSRTCHESNQDRCSWMQRKGSRGSKQGEERSGGEQQTGRQAAAAAGSEQSTARSGERHSRGARRGAAGGALVTASPRA